MSNPQTLNLYTYVRNNPLKLIDPSGHLAQDPSKPKPDPQPYDPNCGCYPYDDVVKVVSNQKKDKPAPTDSSRAMFELIYNQLFRRPTLAVHAPPGLKPWQIDVPMPVPMGLAEEEAEEAGGLLSRALGWLFTEEVAEEAANIGGVTANQATTLRQLLLKIPGVEHVGAFGSRTTGRFAANSDLDIVLIGRINRFNPATIAAVRRAQEYASEIGIGVGRGRLPLDMHEFRSVGAFRQSFRHSFDPARGVPKIVPIK